MTKNNGETLTENVALINNAIAHLFDEIRYELNGIEIDRCKYVGHTSTIKNLLSLTPSQLMRVGNAGVFEYSALDLKMNIENGYFNVTISLSMIFGFAEDYKKIVVNAKHELILIRSRSDLNAVIQTGNLDNNEEFKITINKIEWLVPYILPSDGNKIKLLKFIEKDPLISMSFRSWEMYEYPLTSLTSL
ncbi:uncharacterized protein LOC122512009 [Leptopilina heterotoma]|uniref:uncharacterized protein LOC122512009 n=1 Tax=Leptopilina heterotoma TaxID=63436 RepID=UPI001CA9969A|nr:uncharacterized protein LOC122512009 [Leptopilina heterotoma]